jgi:endonuclease/exonuclease/phosphatase family metal-dependent hydrolase
MLMIFSGLKANATSLRVATYNMQGWIDTTPIRSEKLSKFLNDEKLLDNLAVIMVQESIENLPQSTSQQLANALGWQNFSRKRTSDNEGLGFVYPKSLNIKEIEVLQIKARESAQDYSRMALTMQIEFNSQRIRFINTHLAHLDGMKETRKRQLAEIITWINKLELVNPSTLLILGGDFNTGPQESYYGDEFRKITESAFNFQHVPGRGSNYTYLDKKTGEQRFIDHFFVSEPRAPWHLGSIESKINTHTTEHNLSDHNMVFLDLDIQD